MKPLRTLLATIKKADTLFNLLNDGDKIVVGISGGKDSIVLFSSLVTYKNYAKKTFTLIPVMLDLGFSTLDITAYHAYFANLGYTLHVEESHEVAKILHAQQKLKNLKQLPCSICSKMKKAGVNNVALKLGANKVAFAHHVDDALETLFMNIISGGRFSTFQPKMHLDRADITFIRPLILASEKNIMAVQKELDLPILVSACPNDKKTRREDIKQLLQNIYKTYDSAEINFQRALMNDANLYLWHFAYEQYLPPNYVMRKVTTPGQFNDAFNIRYNVFIKEQSISYRDEYDPDEQKWTTYVVYDKETPIATLRVRYYREHAILKIGRIAVLKPYRGQGIATHMIKTIEQNYKDRLRPVTLQIGGQAYLTAFYEKLGYTKTGEPYNDANIEHYIFNKVIL